MSPTVLSILTDSVRVETRGEAHMIDLTDRVQAIVERHAFREGQALVFVSGSTAGLTTVEFEAGLQRDLPEILDTLIPPSRDYGHEHAWHDGNGHSHVRAALLGPSLIVPFRDGRLLLGTWQQITLVDFDNRPRTRDVVVQLSGRRAGDE